MEVGDVAVDLLPFPVPVEAPVHLPGLGAEVEGAHLVAAGEVLQHCPAHPSGSADYGYFHSSSSIFFAVKISG